MFHFILSELNHFIFLVSNPVMTADVTKFRTSYYQMHSTEKIRDRRVGEQTNSTYLPARLVGDAEGTEAGFGCVGPGEVDGGGHDGGDGSNEAVHLRRLGAVVAGGEGGGPRGGIPVAVGSASAEAADRLPGAVNHQRRRRRRPLPRLPHRIVHFGNSESHKGGRALLFMGQVNRWATIQSLAVYKWAKKQGNSHCTSWFSGTPVAC
jgi:hypothetical protein